MAFSHASQAFHEHFFAHGFGFFSQNFSHRDGVGDAVGDTVVGADVGDGVGQGPQVPVLGVPNPAPAAPSCRRLSMQQGASVPAQSVFVIVFVPPHGAPAAVASQVEVEPNPEVAGITQ